MLEVLSKSQQILKYYLLNFWRFWRNSEIQLSLNWAEVKVCFSPNYYTELKNLLKVKLEAFKSSKKFLKGARADSLSILKCNSIYLRCSFGHLEISGVWF